MSLFGSLMADVEDDPIFGSHMRHVRHMNSMMNSLLSDPFGMFGGGGPLAIDAARGGSSLVPFMPQMPSLNRLFSADLGSGSMGTGSSFSSSTIMMSSGPLGKPQVISTSSSTRIGPNGVAETRKTLQDSRTGTKKMSIESAIEQPEPTEKQSKNATAQEIAKYTALAKADRKINPYEWWALSTNKNGFPILSHHIGDRAHVIEREQNVYSGDTEEHQEFINLDEEEAEDFNREFQQKAGSYVSTSRGRIRDVQRRSPPPQRLAIMPAPSSAATSNACGLAASGARTFGHRRVGPCAPLLAHSLSIVPTCARCTAVLIRRDRGTSIARTARLRPTTDATNVTRRERTDCSRRPPAIDYR
ncbi:Myeloid leukemia factor [Eumeta japonica]|uniref:Myeloid leukemia factor n=1 Tax=Eumeta variegata TaxID=151549 RepID=A0A4C1T5R7_EUMVA|nr:Myeloid leukemia factor [Eumeta japonica]